MTDQEIDRAAAIVRATPIGPPLELRTMLTIAREHNACEVAEPYVAAGAVMMPFDLKLNQGGYAVTWERAANRRELLEILGY